jgi:ABC-type uncharacterized transport system substrate-binding protein
MKTSMITEFVKFQVLESTSDEQLLSSADILNDFQKKQDGFIDAEVVKNVAENAWCFVYHYESMEKVKAIGEKLRSSKVFDVFMPLIVPGSLNVTFHQQLRTW